MTYELLFREYEEFRSKREAQKRRGLNDYSLIGSLLDVNDEVRLHSRFLASLLSPSGKHYQRALFLEHFLHLLDVNDFNYSAAKILREKNFGKGPIDLLITDGEHFLLIENKLEAADQRRQIERYIDSVMDAFGVEFNQLHVVYLSKYERHPGSHSLGKYSLDQKSGRILNSSPNTDHCRYSRLLYREDIKKFIEICRKEVANLSNLKFALDEYQKVVDRVYGNYRSTVMGVSNFINSDKNKFKLCMQLEEELTEMKADTLKIFFEHIKQDVVEMGAFEQLLGPPIQAKHHYSPSDAERFFSSERLVKDKGYFWQVASGQYANKIGLAVLFGKSWLHIGVFSLELDTERLRIGGKVDVSLTKLPSQDSIFYEHRFKHIVGDFYSYGMDLNTTLPELLDYQSSNVKKMLDCILDFLFRDSAELGAD